MTEDLSNNSVMWTRLGEVERQQAAQSTDIRGIYAGLDEIRDVLVRMQESAKPNLTAFLVTIIACCTFLVTIGGLSMAPVYRDISRMSTDITSVHQKQSEIVSNRFTNKDAEALEDKVRAQARETHGEYEGRFQTIENTDSETRARLAYLEGYLKGKDL